MISGAPSGKTAVMATGAGICKRYCSNQRGKAARGLA